MPLINPLNYFKIQHTRIPEEGATSGGGGGVIATSEKHKAPWSFEVMCPTRHFTSLARPPIFRLTDANSDET
jgi:hypothetical protein